MNKCAERLYNGVIKENPTFVQLLGMCPTLAVTSTAINGLGMGLATTAVLTMSNLMISALRKHIPDQVRIPAFITIIASFVTIISFLMQAYTPELYDSLGVFISLIVVNCIILGRAEAYASKNPVLPSIFDGLGMGLGFTVGLTVIGIIREFLGAGTIFGFTVTSELWDPIKIFTANPGAFFVLAFIVAGINAFAIRKAKKTGGKPKLRRIDTCAGCTNLSCAGRKISGEEAAGITADASTEVKRDGDLKQEQQKEDKKDKESKEEKEEIEEDIKKEDPKEEVSAEKLVLDESDEDVEAIISKKSKSGKKASWEGTVTLDMKTGEVISDMDVTTTPAKPEDEEALK